MASAYGVGVGGIPVTQQQLDAASLGSSSSTLMSFPANPGQQMQPQPALQQAFLQTQQQLRATDHGGFGAPLPAAHTDAMTGFTPSAVSGSGASSAAVQVAAASASAVRGLPPSTLAPSSMGFSHFAEPSAAAAGMAPMPSLSFLNSGDLLGSASGSMHVPLDFTMTQVPSAPWTWPGSLTLQL